MDFFGYDPSDGYGRMEDVDVVAGYTDMAGAETVENLRASSARSVKESPAKSLLALWFGVLLTYALVGFYFRRFLA